MIRLQLKLLKGLNMLWNPLMKFKREPGIFSREGETFKNDF